MLAPPELDIKIFKFGEAGRRMSTGIQDQGPREVKDYCHFRMSGRQKKSNFVFDVTVFFTLFVISLDEALCEIRLIQASLSLLPQA